MGSMTVVKICGITNVEDARVAVEAGADMLGFIFYPPSPRYVTPEKAREIAESVRGMGAIRTVGVFVSEPPDKVREAIQTAGLDHMQLHGKETVEMVSEMGAGAFKMIQATDLDTAYALMANYRHAVRGRTPALMVDAPPGKLPGGNGVLADWSVARAVAAEFPILLAGGLNAENVGEAIRQVRPYGVDVSSGVERAPGLKDHDKVREFVARVKNNW
jgi:phosphoribosylanthranilate isomerase